MPKGKESKRWAQQLERRFLSKTASDDPQWLERYLLRDRKRSIRRDGELVAIELHRLTHGVTKLPGHGDSYALQTAQQLMWGGFRNSMHLYASDVGGVRRQMPGAL